MTIAAGSAILASDVLPRMINDVQTSTGANGITQALTTTAGQEVIVFATGDITVSGPRTINLKYNGVTKQSITVTAPGAFCLMYTETPGAATANISVDDDNGNTMTVKIIAIILG